MVLLVMVLWHRFGGAANMLVVAKAWKVEHSRLSRSYHQHLVSWVTLTSHDIACRCGQEGWLLFSTTCAGQSCVRARRRCYLPTKDPLVRLGRTFLLNTLTFSWPPSMHWCSRVPLLSIDVFVHSRSWAKWAVTRCCHLSSHRLIGNDSIQCTW